MTVLVKKLLLGVLFGLSAGVFSTAEDVAGVIPLKFIQAPVKEFSIPPKARHTMPRLFANEPDIVYYFSRPKNVETFPIVLLLGGSYNRQTLSSIFHLHRYFLQECMDLGLAIVSLEQWGVDGKNVNVDTFMEHYTRSRRLEDYQIAIKHFLAHPPAGWNGKFILFGISEGGPLVTRITEEFSDYITATINWAGAEALSWRDEFWICLQDVRRSFTWWQSALDALGQWIPFFEHVPETREEYDALMNKIVKNPTAHKEFLKITYLYHADACQYPVPRYKKIKVPFLVAIGGLDPEIESFDQFVKSAQEATCPLTLIRVADCNHFVRRNPYIVTKTFEWLEEQLASQQIERRRAS